jgi:hypothetical protein
MKGITFSIEIIVLLSQKPRYLNCSKINLVIDHPNPHFLQFRFLRKNLMIFWVCDPKEHEPHKDQCIQG